MAQSILWRLLNNLNLLWPEWLKINIVRKKKGAGQVVVGSLFCRQYGFALFICFFKKKTLVHNCTQASSTTKTSGLCHFAVSTTVFLLFAVLCLFFLWPNTYFHSNAENRWRYFFLSFVLQRGQVCSRRVTSEFKSSVF